MWLTEPLPPGVAAALRRISSAPGVDHVAVIPDVHLSREVCVGTVIATSGPLYPNAVGGDAGCGMAAIRFRCGAELLDSDHDAAAHLLQALYAAVPFGRGCATFLSPNSHGAGRCKSRTEARKTTPLHQLTRELAGIWSDHRLAARLREEAPSSYKEINKVMRAQRELTQIVRKLKPVLCYKGG